MSVTRQNLDYLWRNVIGPRLGDNYVWGGSFQALNPRHGTDCSGAVSECLEALVKGPNMNWRRQLWTGTFAGVQPGDRGPFGGVTVTKDLVCVRSPQDAPSGAAMVIAIKQVPNASNAHMVCEVNGCGIESGGAASDFHIGTKATPITDPMFNQWFYLPGPFTGEVDIMTDTLYADVSEFQVPIDDSYPYRVVCIRVDDGTYQDHKFAQNYAWVRKALDDGRLTFAILYTFVRAATWESNAATFKHCVEASGGLHPRCVIMLDVEAQGCHGNSSADINHLYRSLADYAGDRKRIIGYGNVNDLNACWPRKPDGIRLVVASYGNNPSYPDKVAHQYTNGQGWGGGLPEGAPPFGKCDMNSADGLTAEAFAKACGIETVDAPITPKPIDRKHNPAAIPKPKATLTQTSELWDQLLIRWDILGGRTPVETLGAIGEKLGVPGCSDVKGE